MEITKSAELVSFLDRTVIDRIQAWLQGSQQKIKGAVIGRALALATVGIFAYRLLTIPPAPLRHLPTVNPIRFMYSVLSKEMPEDRSNRLVLPMVRKNHSKGYVTRVGGRWTILVTDPVAAKVFLVKTDNFPKHKSIISMLEDSHPLVKFVGKNNIVLSNGDDWKSQRKAMNPPFHRAMPIELFGEIMRKVNNVVDENQGKPVIINDLMERMTLDALSLGLFAFDFHALDDENSPYVKIYDSIRLNLRDPLVFIAPKLDPILKHFRPSRAELSRGVDQLNALLLSMAQKRREQIQQRRAHGKHDTPDHQKDLLTLILEGELDGAPGLSTDEELRGNLAVFFLAGHETTANALSFALYYLARYPDKQRKAREEVIKVLGNDPEDVLPTPEQLKKLKYIDMIIKETLRLRPPASFINSRRAVQDMYAGDLFIPKDAAVSVDISTIQRHPDVWVNPNEFIPERFEEGAEADQQKGLAWLPFSNGGRQCIGMNFSIAEQRVALSMLLRKFEWMLPEDSIHKGQLHFKNFQNAASKDLTIVFKNRY